ncbi:hypothetical protein C6497_02550 [Candidatus Poribacteria bacterium]|nr:MAG: hypothetical protein C6497_02550 [Candidatus Poribacteria bacterium]
MINKTLYKIKKTVEKYRISIITFHITILFLLLLNACKSPLTLVLGDERNDVLSQLQNRSFRQFVPSKDAYKRQAVIIDFSNHQNRKINLWAQYAEGGNAINEWEILADEVFVYKNETYYELSFINPETHQNLPEKCDDCIITTGVSISIRNLYDDNRIEFRINDENKVLPPPFPVFNSWTTFNEDEIVD